MRNKWRQGIFVHTMYLTDEMTGEMCVLETSLAMCPDQDKHTSGAPHHFGGQTTLVCNSL